MPLIVPLIKKFEWLLLYLSLLIINLVLLLFVLVLFCAVQGTFVVNKSWEHTRCSRGSTSKHNRINLPLLFWILIRLIQNGIARCKDFTLITGMWGDFIAYGALKGSNNVSLWESISTICVRTQSSPCSCGAVVSRSLSSGREATTAANCHFLWTKLSCSPSPFTSLTISYYNVLSPLLPLLHSLHPSYWLPCPSSAL